MNKEYVLETKIKKYQYKCSWYCAKCGNINNIVFGGILDAFRDKTSTREWSVKTKCFNCENVATIYRDECTVKGISQMTFPINEVREDEEL